MQRILYLSVSQSVLAVLICLPEIQKFHCTIMLLLYSFLCVKSWSLKLLW